MSRIICSTVVVLLMINVNYSTGLKWIPLKSGDTIPANAISVNDRGQDYVGRARHYDEVLPAEVNSTFAIIESCGQYIIKRQYEILVSQNNCRWLPFTQIENVPENILHGGTAANGEPIYIGRATRTGFSASAPNNKRIESIYLTTRTKNKLTANGGFMLVCDDNSNWVDTSSRNIPNSTVYGGLSKEGNYIYVARLKSGCTIIPGQVAPELGIASAVYKHEKIQSPYCQVLLGAENEYNWVTAQDGVIPDYAVVSSKEKTTSELMYVALINKTVSYIMPSTAKSSGVYDILVRNVVYVK